MASSTNKAPNKVVIDLLQEKWAGMLQSKSGNKEKLERVSKWAIRNRLPKDSYPSMHCVIDTVEHDQRGMKQQVSYDQIQLEVVYYSRKYNSLWNTHQSIKQIIVEDNKLPSTESFSSTGIEWMRVEESDFDAIHESVEHAVFYFTMKVRVKLQESY